MTLNSEGHTVAHDGGADPDAVSSRSGTEGAVADGTWTGNENQSLPSPPVIDAPAVREQRQHRNNLQSRLLSGLGILFLVTLVLVIGGPSFGWISEDYGIALAQMVFPALLTFGGTIVGTLYNSNER